MVLGIDKFMNEGRAIINMISNAIATILISAWQKSLDFDRVQRELQGEGGVQALNVVVES